MSKVYVICDNDCKYESMTKEDIIAAIAEATGYVPSGEVVFSKIKELNANGSLEFWKGNETQFNALGVSATENVLRIDANGRVYLLPATASGKPIAVSVALANWSGNECTVNVEAVNANSSIVASPAPASYLMWGECQVRATEQGEGYVKFVCEDVPAETVIANLLIVG